MITSINIFSKMLIIAALLIFFAGCGNDRHEPSDAKQNNEQKPLQLPKITIDNTPLFVEIVQESATRETGLMYREDMPENQGMLFVFEVTQILSFWMRNTFIPLDIAFIAESGEIVDIQNMQPLDESKQYVSAKPALYALEVNAGWFAKNSIKVGSKVRF